MILGGAEARIMGVALQLKCGAATMNGNVLICGCGK